MADEAKVYSFEDVAAHTSLKDCWLIIGGKVYDVTQFLEDHPGGDEVLLTATGKDATADFEDVGHSASARAMMEEYYIGKVDISLLPSKPTHAPPEPAPPPLEDSSNSAIKLLQFLVPVIILLLALGLHYYIKSS